MQLWQMDIVEGIQLVTPATGELREAKMITQSLPFCQHFHR
jgi:hypothetical protein